MSALPTENELILSINTDFKNRSAIETLIGEAGPHFRIIKNSIVAPYGYELRLVVEKKWIDYVRARIEQLGFTEGPVGEEARARRKQLKAKLSYPHRN